MEMANAVLVISELSSLAGIFTRGWGNTGMAGKLSFAMPTILYALRSQTIWTQWFSSSLKWISPSGSRRTSSSSFLAGIVAAPSFFTLASQDVRMLSSRSVAVIVSRLPLASQSRFDRIGMVVLRSTTPCVRLSSSSRSNFFMLNSIAGVLAFLWLRTGYSTLIPKRYKDRSRRSVCGNVENQYKGRNAQGLSCVPRRGRPAEIAENSAAGRKPSTDCTGRAQELHRDFLRCMEGQWRRCTRLRKRVEQLIEGAVQVLVAAPQGIDLVDRVQDRRMVLAAELPADLRQRRRGELFDQVHGDLAGKGDGFRIAAHLQVLLAQAELLAHALLNELDGDLLLLRGDDVLEHLLGGGQVDVGAGQRSVSQQASQRALELADIRFDRAGDEFGHLVGQWHALAFGLLLQDGDLGLQVGRLDIGDQAPLEARAQPLLNGGDLLRRAIGGDHDLLLLLVERVESVEELLLSALLAGDELDIVHQQHIHSAEAVAEAGHAVKAQRVDHLVGELFGADIGEPRRGVALLDPVADGLHQVGLAHAHPAIEEQRVVGLRGLLGHGQRGGMGELVRCPHHKRVEDIAWAELVVHRIKIEPGLLGRERPGARSGLRLRAQELQARIRDAHFEQDRLQQFPVGFRQPLAEQPRRHPDHQLAVLGAFLPGGAEPGGEAVRVHPAFHVLEDFVPGIHGATLLTSGAAKAPANHFHRCGKDVENPTRQPARCVVSYRDGCCSPSPDSD